MKNQLGQTVILIVLLLLSCQQPEKVNSPFELQGTIEGISKGTAILHYFHFDGRRTDTSKIENGCFTFTGDLPVPVQSQVMFTSDSISGFKMLYLENSSISLTANASDFKSANVTGSKSNDDYEKFRALSAVVSEKYQSSMNDFRAKGDNVTDQEQKQFDSLMEKYKEESRLVRETFIKENPTSHYAAVIATSGVRGVGPEQLEAMLNALDPAMKNNPLIVSLYERLDKMRDVEIGIDKIMENASNVRYKVDAGFNGDKLLDVVYLSILPNNNVCALQADGNILMITPEGKEINRFKPELKGKASAIAIDNHEQIYVLSGLMKKEKTKIRGKIYEQDKENGVLCTILSKEGYQIDQFQLGGVVTATGARIIDNKLIVSDCKTGKIAIFDAKTGKAKAQIDNMRPCCGILDFSVNENKEILVANLGAFRVQAYDMNGKNIVTFGQRGKSLDDFHGCCNPVSVAYLSSGAIVTVEKDPTRIKIYSKEGAKQIEGIEELVHGCSYIPMTVDSDDNLYLASGSKGMVKCIPVN